MDVTITGLEKEIFLSLWVRWVSYRGMGECQCEGGNIFICSD